MAANNPTDDPLRLRREALKHFFGAVPPDEFRELWDTHPGLAMGLSMDSIKFGEGMILQCRLAFLDAASDEQLATLDHTDLVPFLASSETSIRQAAVRVTGKVRKGSPEQS